MATYEQVQQFQSWFNPYVQQTQHTCEASPDAVHDIGLPVGPEPKNVMETLVMMEVAQQIQKLSAKQQSFIKITQVKAYALNSLPPLYVTSEKGWQKQWERGQHELNGAIATAVRQGFAAVQRDPLREVTPLSFESSPTAEAALKQIQRLLQQEDLTWYTVVPALKKALGFRSTAQPDTSQPLSEAEDSGFDWEEYQKL